MAHCFANFCNGLIGLALLIINFIFNYLFFPANSKTIYKQGNYELL